MNGRRVFKIAVVLAAATGLWWWSRDHVPDLVEPVDANGSSELNDVGALPYAGSASALWADRSYHTATDVPRLRGLRWVPIGRNEARAYRIEVTAPAVVFTLAHHDDLRGLDAWEPLPDSVYVHDPYEPRSSDRLLRLELRPGTYRVRSPKGGPSRPVFFDPERVHVLQR